MHYHPHDAIGLHGAGQRQLQVFTQLPGSTFNERSYQDYVGNANTLRHNLRMTSTARSVSPNKPRRG